MEIFDWATLGLLQQRKKLTNKNLEMQAIRDLRGMRGGTALSEADKRKEAERERGCAEILESQI